MIKSKSLAKKIKKWSDNQSGIVVLALLGSIFGTIIAANSVSSLIGAWYQDNLGWKSTERQKISRLSPNQNLQYVKSIAGEPVLSQSVNSNFREHIFRLRGSWIQVLVDRDQVVRLLNITTCNNNLKLKINDMGAEVLLGETLMSEVTKDANQYSLNETHYFISGATAASYLLDEFYLGNPGNYQTRYIGFTDACRGLDENEIRLGRHVQEIELEPDRKKHDAETVDLIRSQQVINTYVITSPHVNLQDFGIEEYVGIKYTDIRVLN